MDIYKGNSYIVIDPLTGSTVWKGNSYAVINLRVSIQTYKGNTYALIDLNKREPFVQKHYPSFSVANSVKILGRN